MKLPGNSKASQARYHAASWRETVEAAAAAGIDTTKRGAVVNWKLDQDLAAWKRIAADYEAGKASRT